MQFQFDATQVAPSTGALPPIPEGWYPAVIDQSELKDTSTGGKYLEFRFKVIEGDFINHTVFARLNVANSNPATQEYAYKDLSAICHAVNQIRLSDTQELHNKPLKIKVKLREARTDEQDPTKKYDASNEVRGFRSAADDTGPIPTKADQVAGKPAAAPTQSPFNTAPAAQAPAAAPWGAAPTPAAQPWNAGAAQPAQQTAAAQPAQAPQAAQAPAPAAAAPAQAQAQPTAGAVPPWAAGAPAAGGATPPPWATPAQ